MLSAIIFAFAYFASAAATAGSAAHYSVKLTPDFEHRVMRGEEQIEFEHAAGNLEWQKQPGLQVGGMSAPTEKLPQTIQASECGWLPAASM